MTTLTLKAKLARAAAVATVVGIGAGAVLATSGTAGADPKQLDQALVGVGSDTTQDVMNALAGEANGTPYGAIRSDLGSGNRQIISFDATRAGAECVTPRGGSASFDRPNGSSFGRDALSQAFKPVATRIGWDAAAVTCTTSPKAVNGLIDFARSSSGVTTTTGDLVYVPFAADGLSFGLWAPSGVAPVTTLTSGSGSQLTGLHTNTVSSASITVGSTRVIACRIQAGSGTGATWNTKIGSPTPLALETSTAECTPGTGGLNGLQENDGLALQTSCQAVNAARVAASLATAPGDTQCIIGYSAANFIAQANGAAASQIPRPSPAVPTLPAGATFDMGSIDALPTPYDGVLATTPGVKISPNATVYNNATWGRRVFNILPLSTVLAANGNLAQKTLFAVNGDLTTARTLVDGAVTSGSPTLTSATGAFTGADVGRRLSFLPAQSFVDAADGVTPASNVILIGTVTNTTTVQLIDGFTKQPVNATATASAVSTGVINIRPVVPGLPFPYTNVNGICGSVPQTTVNTFGFLSIPECGSTLLRRTFT